MVDDVVIVAAAGKLAAYDLATGDPRWFGPDGGDGYSSPHLLTIDGVEQVLLMSSPAPASVAPADGTSCCGSTTGRAAPASCSRP